MVTLYNVISADGFIARKDGSEDFIPDNLWQNFLSLCKEYGTLIIGRKTYDTIQAYDQELLGPFEALLIRKIISLIKHHLIKEIILHEVPVSIGDGIEPFDRASLLESVKVLKHKSD